MPILFDATCPNCGLLEDVWFTKDQPFLCPICQGPATKRPSFARVVGPTDTRPIYVPNVDKTFHSQKELDAYAQSRGLAAVSSNDPSWTNYVDNIGQDVHSSIDNIHGSYGKFEALVKESAKRKKENG
jgi:uncharacterized Zn finger protein (UPF0148 family)